MQDDKILEHNLCKCKGKINESFTEIAMENMRLWFSQWLIFSVEFFLVTHHVVMVKITFWRNVLPPSRLKIPLKC